MPLAISLDSAYSQRNKYHDDSRAAVRGDSKRQAAKKADFGTEQPLTSDYGDRNIQAPTAAFKARLITSPALLDSLIYRMGGASNSSAKGTFVNLSV